MFLYSGKCRIGTVGQETPYKDMRDDHLFVGDIVVIYTTDHMVGSLTAVVSDEFTSYSDGSHVVKEGMAESFVMGIKGVSLEEPGIWRVVKVKDHKDVVAGEKWKAYGFHYEEV